MRTALFCVSAGSAVEEIAAGTFFALTNPGYEPNETRGPWCPECRRLVHGYGRGSFNVQPRFDHFEGAAECRLSRRSLRPAMSPDLVALGIQQRSMFFCSPWFEHAFRFLEALFGHDADTERFWPVHFATLIRRADKERLWQQVRLDPWKIPFALAAYQDARRSRKGYLYRYVLQFLGPDERALFKCFADSLNRGAIKYVTNPETHRPVRVPVRIETFQEMAMSTRWTERLASSLERVRSELLVV